MGSMTFPPDNASRQPPAALSGLCLLSSESPLRGVWRSLAFLCALGVAAAWSLLQSDKFSPLIASPYLGNAPPQRLAQSSELRNTRARARSPHSHFTVSADLWSLCLFWFFCLSQRCFLSLLTLIGQDSIGGSFCEPAAQGIVSPPRHLLSPPHLLNSHSQATRDSHNYRGYPILLDSVMDLEYWNTLFMAIRM